MNQLNLFDSDCVKPHCGWFSVGMDQLGCTDQGGWPDFFGRAVSEWMCSQNRYPPRILSLFSGAGGLDLGFFDSGFNIVECNEIESDFVATLEVNAKSDGYLSNTKIVCKDIIEYDPDLEDIDFIIGGPPCQTFSAAGARAAGVIGTNDPRGNLFRQYARLLEKFRPRGFLFENVYRIVGAQDGKPWAAIQSAFQDLGYRLFWRILDAADYGVPQFRERLIIVGLKDRVFQFPYPSHGPDSQDTREYYTAGHALSDIDNQSVVNTTLGGRHGHLLKEIPPGLNYSYYTEEMGHPTPFFSWRSKFSDYLYKADPEVPVRTIKAQGGQYTGPFHWDSRVFSVMELKRLQSFPDEYRIVGNRQKAIHQIGNSVPPQLARILALSIADQVFDQRLPFNLDYMPGNFELGFRRRKRLLTQIYKQKAAAAIASLSISDRVTLDQNNYSVNVSVRADLTINSRVNSVDADFIIDHQISTKKVALKLHSNDIKQMKSSSPKYRILVSWPKGKTPDSLRNFTIEMISYSDAPKSLFALWKSVETLARQLFHKDDLVQLFGYYQYKRHYEVNFKLHSENLVLSLFWHIAMNVSNGMCVGKITSLKEIAGTYRIGSDETLRGLIELKEQGFEIRSHNTNTQIPEGMILIPYQFPSLNERSLQRLTDL